MCWSAPTKVLPPMFRVCLAAGRREQLSRRHSKIYRAPSKNTWPRGRFGEDSMKSILVTSFVILALISGVVKAQDNIEKKKIDFLLSSVENMKGAKFIRNGTEHDGKEAAEHLRMKLQKVGGKVQTADDFIRLCASKSFISGKPYMIRSSDGKTINSEQYFREKLKEYNSTAK